MSERQKIDFINGHGCRQLESNHLSSHRVDETKN